MKPVRFERHDSVGHLVLGNPPLNLIVTEFSECLSDAIQEASESEIRVLLIRAEGPNFSQGGDIFDFIDKEFNAWRTFISDMHHSYRKIEALQIPTVCAVRGRAWGGAFELTLACDFIVAADSASFRCIEPSVGTAPVCGGVQRIAERAGPARAARYVMLSEVMSGTTAGELGIAAFVVSEDDVERTASDLAIRLSNDPTRSYAAIRALLKAWAAGGVPGADQAVLDLTTPLHNTEDARRGRTARVEAMRRGVEPEPITFLGR